MCLGKSPDSPLPPPLDGAVKEKLEPSPFCRISLYRRSRGETGEETGKIFLAPLHTFAGYICNRWEKKIITSLKRCAGRPRACTVSPLEQRDSSEHLAALARATPSRCVRTAFVQRFVEQCIKIGSTLSPQAGWIITTAAQTFLNINP